VAAGFEPARGCPLHALQACPFVRSGRPPPPSLRERMKPADESAGCDSSVRGESIRGDDQFMGHAGIVGEVTRVLHDHQL
jgi:hypothetical protein